MRVSVCKHHEPDHCAEVSRNENRGMSRKEAELAAWRWTWRVRMDQMEEVLAMVMRSLTGAPLTVIGISNGAAVAVELALRVPVCSMWLASGVPAEVPGSASEAGESVKRSCKRSCTCQKKHGLNSGDESQACGSAFASASGCQCRVVGPLLGWRKAYLQSCAGCAGREAGDNQE